jgi:hypothetical protein
MTHDELLAMIKPMTNDDAIFMKDALRAVVELHKPIETTPPWGGDKYMACNICEQGTNDGEYKLDYPCPTIQAIEKELT